MVNLPDPRRLALLGLALCVLRLSATDFASYEPDKTGKTDVSALLQRALLDAAKADKVLLIQPGTYRLDQPVMLDGLNALTIASTVPHSANVVFTGPPLKEGDKGWPVPAEPGAARDLEADLAAPAGHGLFEVKSVVYGLTWVGISFTRAYGGLIGHPRGFGGITFRHCYFVQLQVGVWGKPIQIATFDNCAFSRIGVGILGRSPKERLDRSNLVTITNCIFRQAQDTAIRIEGSPVNVRDCDFEHSPGGALYLMDLLVGTVEGCYFEGMGGPVITVSPHRLPVRFQGQLLVHGNQFNVNAGPAVIEVVKGARLHSYDNAVSLRGTQKQQYVKSAPDSGDTVRVEDVTIWDADQP